MVTILPAEEGWGEAFSRFGAGLTQGYTQRSDENAVQKAITDLGDNPSARQILDALTKTKTYSPKAKQTALQNYLGLEKFDELKRHAKEQEAIGKAKNTIAEAQENRETTKATTERNNIKTIVNQLDLPDEQKAELGETISQNAAESLLKDQLKPKDEAKLTPFQKKVQEKNADEYINLSKEIPKIESTLGDIAYARKLSDELGVSGAVLGAAGLSGKAKELEGVSFTLMEPIVKIFNPSGPIAQQKLKMIQDKYVIKASDAPWTKKAKLDALERFAKQALNRAQQKMALIKQYEGNPPEDVIDKFDKESDTLSDAMIDYDLVGEEVKEEGMPSPTDFKGKTVTSPDGKKYFSDGTRWVKK
jgi:hypothetical protein